MVCSMIRIFYSIKKAMFNFIRKLFDSSVSVNSEKENDMKFLIACLGNIGPDYVGTRHNIGFMIGDRLASSCSGTFEDKRYGYVCKCRSKSAELVILKPSTYMNLSGNAVRYWLEKEKIPSERLLVVCDDLSLPLGKLRLRPSGSDGGHNGLKHIGSVLGGNQFARLRVGIGNDFPRGGQIDYVLGKFSEDDLVQLSPSLDKSVDAIKSFCLSGLSITMTQYNRN